MATQQHNAARDRSIFRWASFIVAVGTLVNVLIGGDLLRVVVLHAAWAGWVLLLGELRGREKISLRAAGLASTIAAFAVFVPGLVLVSGRHGGVFYLLFVCTPLLVASMAPRDRPSVILSGVLGVAWIVVFEILAGANFSRIFAWSLFAFLCSAIAWWGTTLHQRSEAERERAEAERLAAVTRLAEQQRKEARAERLMLIGQLAASIAHEVNNPLSFVAANVRYLGEVFEGTAPGADRLEVVNETQEGIERISNTIRMLQVFVQPNGGPPSGHVRDAVNEAVALSTSRLRRVVMPKVEVAEGLPLVGMGHRRLVQMIVNLLLNAADAVEGTPSPRIGVSASRDEKGLRLVVEDSGMRAAQSTRTTPSELPPRAGLGLSLCKEHVEEAGGTLVIEPRAEGGGRIVVLVPFASSSVASSTLGAS
jgi:signal transduction histidine kinase